MSKRYTNSSNTAEYELLLDKDSSDNYSNNYNLSHLKPQYEIQYEKHLVQPSDTLAGLALLYNTTVGELKRLNGFHRDTELHGYREISTPRKLIVFKDENNVTSNSKIGSTNRQVIIGGGGDGQDIKSDNENENYDDVEFLASAFSSSNDRSHLSNVIHKNPETYLKSIDLQVNEIKAKINSSTTHDGMILEHLQGNNRLIRPSSTNNRVNGIEWYLILVPCIIILIVFPILYFVYREHILELMMNEEEEKTNK